MSNWSSREEYLAQYKDPRWQRLRGEIWVRDGFTCQLCGRTDTENGLTVDHSFYDGRAVWEYPEWSLNTVCYEPCNRHLKACRESIREAIARLRPRATHFVAAVLGGGNLLKRPPQSVPRRSGVDLESASALDRSLGLAAGSISLLARMGILEASDVKKTAAMTQRYFDPDYVFNRLAEIGWDRDAE